MRDKLFCITTILSICTSSLFVIYTEGYASARNTVEIATRRRGKPTGGGLGPRVCGEKVLKALIDAEDITSVNSSQASIQFYIPCAPNEIERLEFSLIALPQELSRRTSTTLNMTDTPGYYTHTFEIPEKNKERQFKTECDSL